MTKARFVDSYLLYLMAVASERASDSFHVQVRNAGLRVPEWRVLACLIDSPPLMVTELADLALLEQSRMTKIIDQMDARDLVMRQPDPHDRRRVHISLTVEGRAIALSLVNKAKDHEARTDGEPCRYRCSSNQACSNGSSSGVVCIELSIVCDACERIASFASCAAACLISLIQLMVSLQAQPYVTLKDEISS